MMDFMTTVNRLLQKSSNCRRRRLAVQCYAVTPIDTECGLIEWVPHMVQLRSVIKGYWDVLKMGFSHSAIKARSRSPPPSAPPPATASWPRGWQ
mgnify:CR=1 FL=1